MLGIHQEREKNSSLEAGRQDSASLEALKRIISHPINNKGIRILGILAIAGVSTLYLLPSFEQNHVQASPPNPISFVLGSDDIDWLAIHGTLSLSGSGRGIDSVEVSKNHVLSGVFQPVEDKACYPKITKGLGVREIVWGMLANPAKGKGALAVVVSDNLPDYVHPQGGELADAAAPEDLSKRVCLTSEGLPETISIVDSSFVSFTNGVDAAGDYLEQGINNATIPAKNGKYRLHLNESWTAAEGTWEQQVVYSKYLPLVSKDSPQPSTY